MNEQIKTQLIEYLLQQEIRIDQQLSSDSSQQLLGLLMEKDKTISALEKQLTKSKADHIKNTKLISSLQDKISQLAPNTNNTGSSFMMASEFKDSFDEFMKNQLSSVMSPLLAYPKAYVQYSQELLTTIYTNIKQLLHQKMTEVMKVLNIEDQSLEQQIKISLMKVLQENWEKVFISVQTVKFDYQNEEIQEIEQSEDFQPLQRQFLKLCAYMLLQDKEWEMELPKSKVQHYAKKQFHCIDGWIKEKNQVIVVVQGLKKGETKHPNLKNYVIPFKEEEEAFIFIPKLPKPTAKDQPEIANSNQDAEHQKICFQELLTKQEDNILKSQDTSINIIDRYCLERNKKNKKTRNEDYIESKPLQIHERRCQKNNQVFEYYDTSSKIWNCNENDLSQKTNKSNKSKTKKGKKHGLISDPSFEEIMNFPVRVKKQIELPLKKEGKVKKTNSSNSRKGSIGKIIGQHIEHKQNMNKHNQSNPNKESMYKQLIKQKILHEPQKKNKTERHHDKSKDQDRPLRTVHMKKFRDKYLNR